MGTQGLKARRRLMFGSTTEQVLRESSGAGAGRTRLTCRRREKERKGGIPKAHRSVPTQPAMNGTPRPAGWRSKRDATPPLWARRPKTFEKSCRRSLTNAASARPDCHTAVAQTPRGCGRTRLRSSLEQFGGRREARLDVDRHIGQVDPARVWSPAAPRPACRSALSPCRTSLRPAAS